MNWLQIWPPDGATCIGCQFCHRMHHLHIDSKFDHQMAPIALVPYLTTKVVHQVESLTLPNCLGLSYCPIALLPYYPIALLPYCPIALLPYCPIALLPYCPIALLPLSESHQLSFQTLPNCLGWPYCAIALLLYCPIALLPYCPIALLPLSESHQLSLRNLSERQPDP